MRNRFAAMLMVFGLATSAAQSAEVLRVVADEWPPFGGESLPGKGISLDVISTVLTRAGYQIEPQILPWARIMNGARNDEYDIVGNLFSDADIATFMAYSEPFFQTEVKFVRAAGSDIEVNAMSDLGDHSIAVGDGFLYSPEFDRADDLNKVVVRTAIQGIQMVAYGRADLTLDSEDVLLHEIQQAEAGIADRVEILPFVLATHGIHMAVRQSHPKTQEIVKDFNRVLGEMRNDGSLKALLDQHN